MTSRTALLVVIFVVACSKQKGPQSPGVETKGAFNSPCSSNAECQGMMCRSGRCH